MEEPLTQTMIDTAFISTDADVRLAFYLFRPPFHHRNGLSYLNHLMLTFGRSCHDGFLRTCRNVYYQHLFSLLKVDSFDEMLKQMFKRSMKAIRYFQAYQGFVRDSQRSFIELNGKQRLMLRHLCAYHGYLYVNVRSTWRGSRRTGLYYAYSHFWWNEHPHKDIPVPYSVLYGKRIHDLRHYLLVDRKSTLWMSTFQPNPDNPPPYKKFDTVERKDIACIKIL